jgi:glycosyltransferase involved in cell wall biosynthesis
MGHQVEELEIEPWGVAWPYLSYSMGSLLSLIKFRDKGADIVVADNMECSLLAVLIKKLYGIPFVFDFIDDYSKIIEYDGQSLRYVLARRLERIVPKLADTVIAVDPTKEAFCRSLGVAPEKVVMIPNGCDSDVFSPQEKDRSLAQELGVDSKKVVTFVGKLNGYYELDLVVEAIPRVVSRVPDLKVLFVGEGKDLAALQRRARDLRVEDLVSFIGPYSHEEIPRIINLSDVCILPIPAGSALVLCEYMACERPVIVARGGTEKMGVSRELFPDGCVLRVDKTPHGFAEGMIYLLENRDAALTMGQEARKRVTTFFGWDELSRAYLNVLTGTAQRTS